MVNFEGMSHNPVFTYQVTIGDNVSIGTGNSKKQAKHNAAREYLILKVWIAMTKPFC